MRELCFFVLFFTRMCCHFVRQPLPPIIYESHVKKEEKMLIDTLIRHSIKHIHFQSKTASSGIRLILWKSQTFHCKLNLERVVDVL